MADVPAEVEDDQIRAFRLSRMAKNLGECEASDEEMEDLALAWQQFELNDGFGDEDA